MIHPIEDIRADWVAGLSQRKICKKYSIGEYKLESIRLHNNFPARSVHDNSSLVQTISDLMEPVKPGEFDDEEFFNPERCRQLIASILSALLVDCFRDAIKRDRSLTVHPKTAQDFFASRDFDIYASFLDLDPDFFRERLEGMVERHGRGEGVLEEVRSAFWAKRL